MVPMEPYQHEIKSQQCLKPLICLSEPWRYNGKRLTRGCKAEGQISLHSQTGVQSRDALVIRQQPA